MSELLHVDLNLFSMMLHKEKYFRRLKSSSYYFVYACMSRKIERQATDNFLTSRLVFFMETFKWS